MKTLLVPLSKSNGHASRIGPPHLQNGYRIQVVAAGLLKEHPTWHALLISSNHFIGSPHTELYYMKDAMAAGGAPLEQIIARPECADTQSQIHYAFNYAVTEKFEKIIFISALEHWPRVRWLAKREGKKRPHIAIEHIRVVGIPHIREWFTDVFIGIPYPLIHRICGKLIDRFVHHRRRNGEL